MHTLYVCVCVMLDLAGSPARAPDSATDSGVCAKWSIRRGISAKHVPGTMHVEPKTHQPIPQTRP